MATVEQRLQDLGHPLPHAAAPVASYVPAVKVGALVVTSAGVCAAGSSRNDDASGLGHILNFCRV